MAIHLTKGAASESVPEHIEEARTTLLTALVDLLDSVDQTDGERHFRALLTLGRMADASVQARELLKALDVPLADAKKSSEKRLRKVAFELQHLLA